ncbi:hypothetical protein [Jannaschia sp. M317]|uniref:hypothetical protein n=1 Tax=Jannaschia sp. M317 TaxID=2867011 RepID=UPI0021A3CA93|nr:hypothetical protein [Jannaschia sp. M317]UWQ18854.1 hypothetical protein K3551_06100 [Jannaschia sp. M317]
MAFLPIILLLALLAMCVYFLRATSMAVEAGRPVTGLGGGAAKAQAANDTAKVADKIDD